MAEICLLTDTVRLKERGAPLRDNPENAFDDALRLLNALITTQFNIDPNDTTLMRYEAHMVKGELCQANIRRGANPDDMSINRMFDFSTLGIALIAEFCQMPAKAEVSSTFRQDSGESRYQKYLFVMGGKNPDGSFTASGSLPLLNWLGKQKRQGNRPLYQTQTVTYPVTDTQKLIQSLSDNLKK
jgi:hypothetical protein